MDLYQENEEANLAGGAIIDSRGKRPPTRGAIIAVCPKCQGTGQVPKKPFFLANPKAPLTRAGKRGMETCPACKGSGRLGIE